MKPVRRSAIGEDLEAGVLLTLQDTENMRSSMMASARA